MDEPTREQLSDWITSPTTEWFFDYVQKEWGPAGLRYQQAVREASQSVNAVVDLQKVLYAQESLLALIRHPANVLNVKRQKAEAAARLEFASSRRGPGL